MTYDDIFAAIVEETDYLRKIYVNELLYGDYTPEKKSNIVSYQELLNHEGEEFVSNLYQEILKRPADPEGLKGYTERLESGQISKEQLIASLSLCDESIPKRVCIDGIDAESLPINRLLRLEGDFFVNAIFTWILGRLPLADERKQYLKELLTGGDKRQMIYRLKESPEGAARRIKLIEPQPPAPPTFKQKLLHVPVLGKLVGFIYQKTKGRNKA